MPCKIIYDRAPEFLSELLQDIAELMEIQQLPTAGGHPQTEGLVERFNRTLKNILCKLVEKKGKNWDTLLGPVLHIGQPHMTQLVSHPFSDAWQGC